jgi:hypothetical protein
MNLRAQLCVSDRTGAIKAQALVIEFIDCLKFIVCTIDGGDFESALAEANRHRQSD